jgi:hypothetical protein
VRHFIFVLLSYFVLWDRTQVLTPRPTASTNVMHNAARQTRFSIESYDKNFLTSADVFHYFKLQH